MHSCILSRLVVSDSFVTPWTVARYPEVKLLNHMVILFLNFQATFTLFFMTETQTQGKATHGCLGQQTQLGPQPAMASTTRLILEGDLRSGAPSPKPWTSTKYMPC